MPDIYDWVLSPEVRDYLRANHIFSVEEKVEIVCGGCRSIEEKYETLGALLKEAEIQEDKELIQSLLRLYDWAFDELHKERQGQIFAVMACEDGQTLDAALRLKFGGIEQMFRTYEELQNYIKEYETDYQGFFRVAYIEKWAIVNGKMQETIGLFAYALDGRMFIQKFRPYYLERCVTQAEYEAMGISWDALHTNEGHGNNYLPLPFQNGDLVRIDIPELNEPIYGVLHIYDALGRYIYMAYIEEAYLKTVNMSYEEFDVASGWRVIDWTHPAQPSELPVGQKLLAELSGYMHRMTDLDAEAKNKLRERIYFCKHNPKIFKMPITLEELLNDEQFEETD